MSPSLHTTLFQPSAANDKQVLSQENRAGEKLRKGLDYLLRVRRHVENQKRFFAKRRLS